MKSTESNWPRGGAWWRGNLSHFERTSVESVVGRLSTRAGELNLSMTPQSIRSWEVTASILKEATQTLIAKNCEYGNWGIIFEYEIPRRAVRPDVILLIGECVVVLEFKVFSDVYERADQWQVTEYARDLHEFHEDSHYLKVVPVLVSTSATNSKIDLTVDPLLDHAQLVSPHDLVALFGEIVVKYGGVSQLSVDAWSNSRYHPTPNILQTALEVFSGHSVVEIQHAYADNLDLTVDAIRKVIRDAKQSNSRNICFVTGVPGSGKTLTGLSAVHEAASGVAGQALGTYLSGNGPLVAVLRYAIAVDLKNRSTSKLTMKQAERLSSVFIQPVHKFINELHNSRNIPPENVIVFDEAQRAWDQSHMLNKTGVNDSEATAAMSIMERTNDWSVIVAIVGEGQEINSGEAGISAWTEAVHLRPQWTIHIPTKSSDLIKDDLKDRTIFNDALHLSVGVRSPRASRIAEWVDALLAGKFDLAKEISVLLEAFPLLLTRDIEVARQYLRDRARVDRRVGLLASSQDRRLRAFGLERSTNFLRGINWAHWFVNDADDVRSSYSLEVAASEFECQGLELDWAVVCWGSDMLFGCEGWITRKFRGSRWQKDSDSTFALNRYRVLLTRARYGMIVWVPSTMGKTIKHVDGDSLDEVANLLVQAGVKSID